MKQLKKLQQRRKTQRNSRFDKERQIVSEDKTRAYNKMVNRNHSKRTRI